MSNEYINRYIHYKEIEVWRKDKLLSGERVTLQKNDIIKLPQKYQISLLYNSKFFKSDS